MAGGYRYLYVAIDKFTKWAEVEPVCTISASSVVKFNKGIVCLFGVPNHIITGNGRKSLVASSSLTAPILARRSAMP